MYGMPAVAKDFSTVLEFLADPSARVCVWVYDILAQNGKDLLTLNLSARRQKLNKLMARIKAPSIQCSQVSSTRTRS